MGVIISSDDIETVWNAFRLGNFARKEGDDVSVFLVAKGVEYESKSTEKFPAKSEAEKFLAAGGNILACGTCLQSRNKPGVNICPISSLKDLYELIRDNDKVVSF